MDPQKETPQGTTTGGLQSTCGESAPHNSSISARQITVAIYANEKSAMPECGPVDIASLQAQLFTTNRTDCTLATCKGKDCPHKSGPAWSPVVIEGSRNNKNVKAVTGLVFDIDGVSKKQSEDLKTCFGNYAGLIHSTHSHRENNISLRLVLWPSREVDPLSEFPALWKGLIAKFNIPCDLVCKDVARLYFLPSTPKDGEFVCYPLPGTELVDVDLVLREFPPSASASTPKPSPPVEPTDVDEEKEVIDLLANCYPKKDTRRQASLALTGGLIQIGYIPEEAAALTTKVHARVNGNDGEPEERLKQALRAQRRIKNGEPVEGFPSLPKYGVNRFAADRFREFAEKRIRERNHRYAESLGVFDSFFEEIQQAKKDIEEFLGVKSDKKRAPLFESFTDLEKKPRSATRWLFNGLIPQGTVGVLGSAPKTAKTWVAEELSVALISGKPAFDQFEVPQPGIVAYFFAEDDEESIITRTRALANSKKLDSTALARFYPHPKGTTIDVMNIDDLAWIVASCRRVGNITFLILDPFRDIHTANEDSSTEMAPVMKRLLALQVVLGCTVLFVHHSSKYGSEKQGSGQSLRGSTVIHGSVGYGIYLSNPGGNGETIFKNLVKSETKYGRSAGKFELTLTVEDDRFGHAIKTTWKYEKAGNADKAEEITFDDEYIIHALEIINGLENPKSGSSKPVSREKIKKGLKIKSSNHARDLIRFLAARNLVYWCRNTAGKLCGVRLSDGGKQQIQEDFIKPPPRPLSEADKEHQSVVNRFIPAGAK